MVIFVVEEGAFVRVSIVAFASSCLAKVTCVAGTVPIFISITIGMGIFFIPRVRHFLFYRLVYGALNIIIVEILANTAVTTDLR